MPITTDYSVAYIYTKHTDLLQWFDKHYSDVYQNNTFNFNQLRQHYAKLRAVELVLLVRFDGNHTYCKIRCPINPIPVRGEFETPSISCVQRFLVDAGWSLKQKLAISFLE